MMGGGLLPAHGNVDLPTLTGARVWSTWDFEPLVIVPLILAAVGYLAASASLRRGGNSWSRWKDLSWLTGLGLILVSTCSVVGVYDTTLFSAHALQHMGLQMFAPAWLAMATPITLALRVLPLQGRKRLVRVLHSRPSKLITQPLVAFAVFSITPFVLYYSPLYVYTLRHDWAHNLSHLHFVAVGMLMFTVVLGTEPLPRNPPFIYRFALIPGTGISHVLLGVPIMMGTTLFAGGFYQATTEATVTQLVADQQLAGSLLWILGDVTMLFFLIGFIPQWVKADQREARRTDRQLDRVHRDALTTTPWWEAGRPPQG